jgi:hypothetical protein
MNIAGIDTGMEHRRALVDAAVMTDIWFPGSYSEADKKRTASGHHQYRHLLEELVDAALKQGVSLGGAVWQASYIVRTLKDAVVSPFGHNGHNVEKQINIWNHIDDTAKRVRTADFPDLRREDIEAAAAAYLKTPVRSQKVDRLLVDLLVAVEYFAYAEHIRYSPTVRVRHPLSVYARARIRSAIFFAAVAGVVYAVTSVETAFLVALACLALFGIDTILATIGLLIALVARAQGKGTATSNDLLLLMDFLYQDLKSDGLISAFHIREKARKADERGVRWPATLFALLDDIAARTGRF